ncbi:MAG: hypothetical protein M3153_08255 [Chloroflexota bacterium]|nr:hypothetical protein [Chloroflexota bacterium]
MSRYSSASSITRPLLVAAAVLLGVAGPVSANHEPARLGLTPVGQDGTYFEITLEPGEERRLTVEAANFGHEETLARTYAADVYSIVNGGFGADLFGERPSGTTLWVTYPSQEITLGANDAIVIDFQVEVPENTPPGEYVTALVIENAEPMRGSGTIAVDQVNRSAIAVAIEVPGERTPALSIGEIHHQEVSGLSVVSFDIDNPGNVHVRPAGEFVLRNGAGTEIAASSVAMDSVYAGTSTLLEAAAVELLDPGEYCAELTLTDEETGATDTTDCRPFTVGARADDGSPFGGLPTVTDVAEALGTSMPVLPLLMGLLAAATAAILILVGRRRRRTAIGEGETTGRPAIGRTAGKFADTVGDVGGGAVKAVGDALPIGGKKNASRRSTAPSTSPAKAASGSLPAKAAASRSSSASKGKGAAARASSPKPAGSKATTSAKSSGPKPKATTAKAPRKRKSPGT